MLLENRSMGIRDIAKAVNISTSQESTQHVLVDILGTKWVAAKLVPKDPNVHRHIQA